MNRYLVKLHNGEEVTIEADCVFMPEENGFLEFKNKTVIELHPIVPGFSSICYSTIAFFNQWAYVKVIEDKPE